MEFSHIEMGICTDVGKARETNEDAGVILPELGFCAVADGMGGAEAGEVASAWVINHVLKRIKGKRDACPEERCLAIKEGVLAADRDIFEFSQTHGFTDGSGTTVIALLFNSWYANEAMVLHVGDSRAYRWRNGILEQLEKDHTISAQTGIDEKKLPRPYRGVLTKAVGTGKKDCPERTPVDVAADDLFVLCSDGLTKVVSDKKMAQLLGKNKQLPVAEMAQLLVNEALAGGGPDNVTVAAIRVKQLPPDVTPTETECETNARLQKNWTEKAAKDPSEEDTEVPE
jgi:serine/threonine protein phosphatase PrpC